MSWEHRVTRTRWNNGMLNQEKKRKQGNIKTFIEYVYTSPKLQVLIKTTTKKKTEQ